MKRIYITNLLILIFTVGSLKCNGQNNVEISTGFGLMELLNIGFAYNFTNKIQSGLKIGTVPVGKDEHVLTMTGGLSYFYTGKSEYTSQPTWYINGGINYLRDDTQSHRTEIVFLNLRHGRVFNFSKKMGLKLEAGIGIGLYYNETSNLNDSWIIDPDSKDDSSLPIMPNIGIDLFYRF